MGCGCVLCTLGGQPGPLRHSKVDIPGGIFSPATGTKVPPVLTIQVRGALILAVNCATAWLTAAALMDSNMSKSWWAPGSSA